MCEESPPLPAAEISQETQVNNNKAKQKLLEDMVELETVFDMSQ